jgi:GntR family transcriptional regulator, transcriptional repressor for pyruvate dehydrogenase complex
MSNIELKRLEHTSLSQRAGEALLNHILDEDLKPGATLPSVAALAASLGVSRPIIRESLNALRALGIIEIANGKKATVRDLDSGILRVYFGRAVQVVGDSVRDVMDVRIGIEVRSAVLAARCRDARAIAGLHDLLRLMQGAIGHAESFSRYDSALHLAISEASGNKLIFHIVESLQSALRKASYQGVRAISDRATLTAIYDEHVRLVAAIERGDEVGAGDLMRDHLVGAMTRMAL